MIEIDSVNMDIHGLARRLCGIGEQPARRIEGRKAVSLTGNAPLRLSGASCAADLPGYNFANFEDEPAPVLCNSCPDLSLPVLTDSRDKVEAGQ